MGVVTIAALGSVDDGKSTLLGRLLLDAGALSGDEREAVADAARRRGRERSELAFYTDGLTEERAQGVTVDLAHRMVERPSVRLHLVDCPGHARFAASTTAGVSSADGALVALDVTRGLGDGARAHLATAAVLGGPRVVVALTKMDAVGFSEDRGAQLSEQVRAWLGRLGRRDVEVVPTAAVEGDQVVWRSDRLRWYEGPTVLEALELTPPARPETGFRVVVQGTVAGPDGARWILGRLSGDKLGVGASVVVLPSGEETVVERLVVSGRPASVAHHGSAVALGLADPLCIARGEVIVGVDSDRPQVVREAEARLRWLAPGELRAPWRGEARLAGTTCRAVIDEVVRRLDVEGPAWVAASRAAEGDLVDVRVAFAQPVVVDEYARNRETGSLVLADPTTLEVVAIGALQAPLAGSSDRAEPSEGATER